jgi:hypothetical protein
MVYRRDYSRQWPLNPFAPAKQAILCTELKKSGVLATHLQITMRKVLYTSGRLLLRFNVIFDKCHLNAGF